MYFGDLVLGSWDSTVLIPEGLDEIIDANADLSKAILNSEHFRRNYVSLYIDNTNLLVNIENTQCTNCSHVHHCCAIPERSLGKDKLSGFISNLKLLSCDNCGSVLSRGVIWKGCNYT